MFTTAVSGFLTSFFSLVKSLFDITWPGTNLSIFGIFIGVLVTYFIIGFSQHFLGNTFTIATSNHSRGNSNDLKISGNRKDDER